MCGSDRRPGLDHPVLLGVFAVLGLVVSAVVAVRDPVPGWELELTEWINDVPDVVASLLYPVMQLGTVGAPIAVGVAIGWRRRDGALGIATVLAGFVTWFAAKGVKRIFERDRPLAFLPELLVREGDGAGLGYLSGHSAVAACSAVCAAAALPHSWRPVVALAAALVGIARIVHGVHLPADVVGGWSLGILAGLATLWVVERWFPLDDTANRPHLETAA